MNVLVMNGLVMNGLVMNGLAAAEPQVDFVRDIRPILSDHCFNCHGPDESQRDSALRLDRQESMLADLGGYAAVVPGDVEASALVQRITSTDADLRMPPEDFSKPLTAAQQKLLIEWVRQGAVWEEHWSFAPLSCPDVPAVDGAQCTNEVDHFVAEKLREKGWPFSPEADRRTLLRRLSFDLIGLPPSARDVADFLEDDAPDAYEKVVDTLLASPHFGERMAVYWLDLVRYADTVGYHGDQPVSISPYRDYVIAAFNENMPFDQFTREQLAGDLLPAPTQRQLIASGYNRLGMMSAEGGVQPKEYLAKYAADRVRTTASVWLGITMGCAECHDHKYDPLSSQDFYRFAAFFADIKERGLYSGSESSGKWGPTIDVDDPQLPRLLAPLDERLRQLERQLLADDPLLRTAQQSWEANLRTRATAWENAAPIHWRATGDVQLERLSDDSLLATGANPGQAVYAVAVPRPEGDVTGMLLEALPHKSLPAQGAGRAGNGNFVVTEIVLARGDLTRNDEALKTVDRWSESLRQQMIPLQSASATIEQTVAGDKHPDKKWSAASAIDGETRGATWGWAILPEVTKPQQWVAQRKTATESSTPKADSATNTNTNTDTDTESADVWTVLIYQNHDNAGHTLGRFRIAFTETADPVADPLRQLPEKVAAALRQPVQDRTADHEQELLEYFRATAPETAELRGRIDTLHKRRSELVQQHQRSTLITVSVSPRTMRVLPRGNWMDESGPVVQPGVPEYFRQIAEADQARATRLDLANWIVAPDNPLTARVLVNRLWKLYFGKGLAPVLDDVGAQGTPPIHPELLDYLACQLVNSGWDLKQLIKTIVMSRAYRQTSQVSAEMQRLDPYNVYWARQSRYRLDAEFIRDNALAVSGLLVRNVGGRSVKPYQPAGLYRHLNFPTRTYQADADENQYRRGVYTHWQRQYLHPAMKTFDAPAREECTAERPRSNTPLGALVLLNDPSYVEAARVFATRAVTQATTAETRLDWMFVHALHRPPTPAERSIIEQLVARQREYFAEHPAEAEALLQVGMAEVPAEVPTQELAVWTSAARAVFNMYEFVARY